ncbi:hypothetical protein YTPLAS18_15410 [Nitrospira sp.]|nr:hypothetical protein YTPLAS18_15410 [Nitrospira sp.]
MGACDRWLGVVLVLTLWSAPASSGMLATPEWGSASGDSTAVLVYNDDQLKGQWKQFKGEIKKKWAEFTDDDLLYVEGKKDKLEGKIQERYGDRRDEVKEWVDEWFERHPSEPRHSSH